jgi:hypothetical protein
MQNIQNDIQTLLQKDMSRKEFLRVSGAAILGFAGVTGLVQGIQKLSGSSNTVTGQKVTGGYGSSPYGQ